MELSFYIDELIEKLEQLEITNDTELQNEVDTLIRNLSLELVPRLDRIQDKLK